MKVDCAHLIHVHTAIKAGVIALQHAMGVVIFILLLVFYFILSWASENDDCAWLQGTHSCHILGMIKILTAETRAFGVRENPPQKVFKEWLGMLWGALQGAGVVWSLALTWWWTRCKGRTVFCETSTPWFFCLFKHSRWKDALRPETAAHTQSVHHSSHTKVHLLSVSFSAVPLDKQQKHAGEWKVT